MRRIIVLGSVPRNIKFPILSWLIRLVEGSRESHVGLFFPAINVVTDAYYNTINVTNYSIYKEKHKIKEQIELEITDDEYLAILDELKEKHGKQEGYWCTFFGSFFPILLRRLSLGYIKIRNCCPFSPGLTCSEYIRHLFEVADIPKKRNNFFYIPKYTTSTSDIIEYCDRIKTKSN